MALALENLPSDARGKPRYTAGNCSEALYSVVQRMEAEHIISIIVTEVFEGLKWKERMKVDLKNNEVAIVIYGGFLPLRESIAESTNTVT